MTTATTRRDRGAVARLTRPGIAPPGGACRARRVEHAPGVRMFLALGLAAVGVGGGAAAAPAPKASPPGKPPPPPVWIGVFDPRLPVHAPWDNGKLTPVPHGGAVRVLAPDEGPAASGDVVIVHPLLGKLATGKVDQGVVVLAEFAFDQRDGDDGVIVVPGGTAVTIVAPNTADVAAIKATLVKTDALAGVRRALAGLELAAIDLDGDGKADVVATYGCTAWFDGSCQARGQFFLARRGARWVFLE